MSDGRSGDPNPASHRRHATRCQHEEQIRPWRSHVAVGRCLHLDRARRCSRDHAFDHSLRLVEVADREGTPARLIQRADEIDFEWLRGVATLGITAGASAPEVLVREVVAKLSEQFDIEEREVEEVRETVSFKLPRGLEAA